MVATNAQVQAFVDSRVRPQCEQIRALYLSLKDSKAAIDDVYANLINNPTWEDSRSDHPPYLLTPNDVLQWNAFITAMIAFIEGNDDYVAVLKGCVRGV